MSLTDETFGYVAQLVREESAIHLPAGKEYLVAARLTPLARERGFTGSQAVDDYVLSLRISHDRARRTELVEAMTTNETSWFRDTAPFTALSDVILADLRKTATGNLNIWSAACSTGQEPYSIAMTLLDAGEQRFSILATDLSAAVLGQAKVGTYSQLEMNRGMPARMLVRYFQRSGAGWQIDERLRRRVVFQQHNLLDAPPPCGLLDIVFMRNVLIYFDTSAKRAILSGVRRSLRPGGFLVLGSAETPVGVHDSWQRVPVSRGTVYRNPGGRS